MIMRSDWRGEPRNTSAPKRAMSKREADIDIISIAQQAKPNDIGQIEFLRAQLMAEPSVVVTMPSNRTLSSKPASSMRANRSAGPLANGFSSMSLFSHDLPFSNPGYTQKLDSTRTYEDALDVAADLWGIEPRFHDIWGNLHVTSAETKQAILRAVGVGVDTRDQIEQAIDARRRREWT